MQAFRRQGRRFGAGLVCSEMVSSCGLSYGNERTLGYLRISSDEHPLAVQIFGSEADRMAEAAQMVVAAGADIVDINFGCPVRKVTKTGAGASALEDHDLACELVSCRRRRGRRAGDGEDAARASQRIAGGARARPQARGDRGRVAHAAPPLGPADVHRHRRPHAHRGAGRARRSARDRLGRHHRPAQRRARPRGHRRGRGDGRPRRPGAAVGAARDGGRRRGRRGGGGGGRRARPVHARGGARDGRRARDRLSAQVLRLVPARPAGRQADPRDAGHVPDGRRRRARRCSRSARRRARSWPRTRPSSSCCPTPTPTGCSTCRSRSTAAADQAASAPNGVRPLLAQRKSAVV